MVTYAVQRVSVRRRSPARTVEPACGMVWRRRTKPKGPVMNVKLYDGLSRRDNAALDIWEPYGLGDSVWQIE